MSQVQIKTFFVALAFLACLNFFFIANLERTPCKETPKLRRSADIGHNLSVIKRPPKTSPKTVPKKKLTKTSNELYKELIENTLTPTKMKQTTCDIQRFTQEAANLWWIGNEHGKQWNPAHLVKSKKFAYVWWTSISEYTWSALVAIKSLKSTNPSEQIDFVLIHTIVLSDKQKQLLDAFGVKCISFENAVSVQNSYYKYANNKLYIFKLTQYDKLLFMDSDSMPLQNLDHMFMFPDAPVVAPCPYWEPEQQPKFVSWFMLVMPNENSFNTLLKRASDMPSQPDMETFNDVFKKEMILLPSYYGLLNSEWENDRNIAFHNHDKDIYTKAPIVHYTIKGKPWQHAKDFFKGKLWDIEADLLHKRWWDLRESLIVPKIDKLPPCFELLKPDSIFIKTGDIPDMWIRDSTAQVWPYRDTKPRIVEKVLNMQSFFILQDPYANSYRNHKVGSPTRADLKLGRKGWVATRNYELDSGCYFVRLLHYAWKHHDLSVQRYRLTVETLVRTWKTEQRHEENSPYRYAELPRNGLGSPVTWTGLTWSGFRPSDDACQYGYHIPSNFFAAEALALMLEMFPAMKGVAELRSDILNGIQTHGVWKDSNGDERYCYEVDGLGNCNKMDDANVPSLLSIPYLSAGDVNHVTWKNTYDWIWSSKNPYFFKGKAAEGIGSLHTPHNYIWPMSIIIRGIVDPAQCQVMKALTQKTMTRNTIHESFDKDNAHHLTREDFAWPNALYQEMDCENAFSIGISAIWDDNRTLDGYKTAKLAKDSEPQVINSKNIHTHWKGLWSKDPGENLKKMLELRSSNYTRSMVPLQPPWTWNHPDRRTAVNAILTTTNKEPSSLKDCQPTFGITPLDIVIPLLDPTDPALKRTLRSFEKNGLLDLVRHVHIITNDDSVIPELHNQYKGLKVVSLADVKVPFHLADVKEIQWAKMYASAFVNGLAENYIITPDDTILNRPVLPEYLFDFKKHMQYAHSFGTAGTGNTLGHRNIAPLHGPNLLNTCTVKFIINKYKDTRPAIDPISVTFGEMKSEGLISQFFSYHSRKFRDIAGMDYYSECHTNGGCSRPGFDDLFVNIQGDGISKEYRSVSSLKKRFDAYFETEFPNASRYEK